MRHTSIDQTARLLEIIKWNADLFGVEIKGKKAHFVVSAMPSFAMNWHEAVRLYNNGNNVWQLPTREHLKLVAEHIDDVNALIKANGGDEIRGWHWTADEYNEFCAWLVRLSNGYTHGSFKNTNFYVRAVSAFQN